jgi:hypothetical protein
MQHLSLRTACTLRPPARDPLAGDGEEVDEFNVSYRPLLLGSAAAFLPSHLHYAIAFPESERSLLMKTIMQALGAEAAARRR